MSLQELGQTVIELGPAQPSGDARIYRVHEQITVPDVIEQGYEFVAQLHLRRICRGAAKDRGIPLGQGPVDENVPEPEIQHPRQGLRVVEANMPRNQQGAPVEAGRDSDHGSGWLLPESDEMSGRLFGYL